MIELINKLLDQISDTYHCKKCSHKLGCDYCKTYAGMIKNNKYNK